MTPKTVSRVSIICRIIVPLYLLSLKEKYVTGNPGGNVGHPSVPKEGTIGEGSPGGSM